MIFNWFKNRRRRKLIAQPFSEEWDAYLLNNVHFYLLLTEHDQQRLKNKLRILIAEKYWEGCNGFQMTDEVKVTIAAQAALLLLGLEEQYFHTVQSILVYPSSYVVEEKSVTPAGVEMKSNSAREGEAWSNGPVILSWDNVLQGGQQSFDGRNLVFHEFAHQLDMQNGSVNDGTPWMKNKEQYDKWKYVMQEAYQQLVHDCSYGQQTLLNCYGATNISEFFAVATECFFERSHEMQHYHLALYDLLAEYYNQNPASW